MPTELWIISVKGVVQGVGFRPFVYQLAVKHGFKGWVLNASGSVQIEAEGAGEQLKAFTAELKENHPPQAVITDIKITQGEPKDYSDFHIMKSIAVEGDYQLISPDIATCADCVKEIKDSSDRRFRYPFTNCTNCGPRFTIIEDIPYDRPLTTMKHFKMCEACQAEYDNPLDRRFHAQPNACPVCGPKLLLADSSGKEIPSDDVIKEASALLKEGAIIAIKGLGGFLLACNACDSEAVKLLRERKKRPSKPFAVMLASLDKVKEHCSISEKEAELLSSPKSPIVLLNWKEESSITREVAPGLKHLGVMLPYTPLHHILLDDVQIPLIMTSGNLSEEPIARDNDEALERLKGIADYFILHNRDIYSTYDDSVAVMEKGTEILTRRARGYAPYPIRLPFGTKQVLACGAEEKNTFCLTRDNNAFISQHIGDMENLETLNHYEETVALYEKMFRVKPSVIACDMHPDYMASKWGRKRASDEGLRLEEIQHHHAHIASCMAENGVKGKVIGVAFDGTGYGTDGKIWGGEFFVIDYVKCERKAHFEYLPLPGGDASVKKPYRTAVSYLYYLLGKEVLTNGLPPLDSLDNTELELIFKQIDKNLNTPYTSSCGRLFDAASSIAGVCQSVNYHAQAAIEFEEASFGIETDEAYPFSVSREEGASVIKLKEMFEDLVKDALDGVSKGEISAKFHNTMANMILSLVEDLRIEAGLNTVALSGGVFQNRRLLGQTITRLEEAGFKVLYHKKVPCNDGGISLGQAVIASVKGGV